MPLRRQRSGERLSSIAYIEASSICKSASKSSFTWKGAQYSPRFGRVNTSLAVHAQPLEFQAQRIASARHAALLRRDMSARHPRLKRNHRVFFAPLPFAPIARRSSAIIAIRRLPPLVALCAAPHRSPPGRPTAPGRPTDPQPHTPRLSSPLPRHRRRLIPTAAPPLPQRRSDIPHTQTMSCPPSQTVTPALTARSPAASLHP
jgi:hypothetical protein